MAASDRAQLAQMLGGLVRRGGKRQQAQRVVAAGGKTVPVFACELLQIPPCLFSGCVECSGVDQMTRLSHTGCPVKRTAFHCGDFVKQLMRF